jgi:predicted RNase H-like HicB family nuclease
MFQLVKDLKPMPCDGTDYFEFLSLAVGYSIPFESLIEKYKANWPEFEQVVRFQGETHRSIQQEHPFHLIANDNKKLKFCKILNYSRSKPFVSIGLEFRSDKQFLTLEEIAQVGEVEEKAKKEIEEIFGFKITKKIEILRLEEPEWMKDDDRPLFNVDH